MSPKRTSTKIVGLPAITSLDSVSLLCLRGAPRGLGNDFQIEQQQSVLTFPSSDKLETLILYSRKAQITLVLTKSWAGQQWRSPGPISRGRVEFTSNPKPCGYVTAAWSRSVFLLTLPLIFIALTSILAPGDMALTKPTSPRRLDQLFSDHKQHQRGHGSPWPQTQSSGSCRSPDESWHANENRNPGILPLLGDFLEVRCQGSQARLLQWHNHTSDTWVL